LWQNNVNVSIQNNIFYAPLNYAINRSASVLNGCFIDHNIVFGANGMVADTTGCTISNNMLGTDPLFVNSASAPFDFHVQASSPAIDAGVTIPGLTNDYDGNPRPQGKGYDIGAYEATP
ncbi:MAG: choice-of-anchor Q domain-containing protein, partial [Chitinivibrionales bacterium]|nr:choice-of-anchor Q domain-containing protein [Chitinivibrionales bacterium]